MAERGHVGALARTRYDQALRFELPQCFADRNKTDAKLRRDFAQRELLTGLQRSGQDGSTYFLRDLIDHRGWLDRTNETVGMIYLSQPAAFRF